MTIVHPNLGSNPIKVRIANSVNLFWKLLSVLISDFRA